LEAAKKKYSVCVVDSIEIQEEPLQIEGFALLQQECRCVCVCVFLPLQIEPFGFASGSMSVSLPLQIEPFDFVAATIVSLTLQIEPFGLLQQEYLSLSPSAD
jgi:hypothetical protein